MRRESVKSRIHPYFFCVTHKMLQGRMRSAAAMENGFRLE